MDHPVTPDGRYFVVRGRLWRSARPDLSPERHEALVDELMSARRAAKTAGRTGLGLEVARQRVNASKIELGEWGPVWWADGAPDWNKHLVKNTPYAGWFAALGRLAGKAVE